MDAGLASMLAGLAIEDIENIPVRVVLEYENDASWWFLDGEPGLVYPSMQQKDGYPLETGNVLVFLDNGYIAFDGTGMGGVVSGELTNLHVAQWQNVRGLVHNV